MDFFYSLTERFFNFEEPEKILFENETVSEIDCTADVTLKSMKVKGSVSAGRHIKALNSNLGSIEGGGKVTIVSTNCLDIDTEDLITAENSNAKDLLAKRVRLVSSTAENIDVELMTAEKCLKLGEIFASGEVVLKQCKNVFQVNAKDIILDDTKIRGNATARRKVLIQNSSIEGTLTCSTTNLTLEKSRIKKIYLNSVRKLPNVHQNSLSVYYSGAVKNRYQSISCEASLSQRSIKEALERKTDAFYTLHLHDCIVDEVVFGEGKGEVILHRNSRVETVVGGKIKKGSLS